MTEEEFTVKGPPLPEFTVKGPPLKQASKEFQIIAILTKKLGGYILIDVDEELKTIEGFIMQQNPDGKISIRSSCVNPLLAS